MIGSFKRPFTNTKTPLPQSPLEPMQRERVALLCMGHFANDSYVGFLAPLLPLLMAKIGFSLTLAGLLTSIQAVFTSILQPLFGLIADKIRRPHFAAYGPLVTALFLGSIGLWSRYEAIVVILILAGLGTASFHPQAAMLAGHASGNRRGFGMSLFVTAGTAGHSLGPMSILPIVVTLGLEFSFVTILYGIVASALLVRNLPLLSQAPFHHADAQESPHVPHRRFALGILWMIVMFRALIIAGFLTFVPIFLHRQQYGLLLSGSANTIFELSGAAGAITGGILSDRLGRKKVIVASFIAAMPFLWLFLHTAGKLSLALLGLGGFILYTSIPVSIIMAQELYPKRASTVSSLMIGLAWGMGGLLVTPMGAIAEKIGVAQALSLLVFLGVAAVVATFFLPAVTRGGEKTTQLKLGVNKK